MYQSLEHALRDAFTQSERLIMGYSNTASIQRLGEQCGASGCTSTEELSQQERLAQAVWLMDIIDDTLRCPMELAAICCQYGQGSTRYAEGLVELAKHFDYVHGNILVIDDLLSNLYHSKSGSKLYNHGKRGMKSYPSLVAIADTYDFHVNTMKKYRGRIEKKCREWQYQAEDRLLAVFEDKNLIKKKVA